MIRKHKDKPDEWIDAARFPQASLGEALQRERRRGKKRKTKRKEREKVEKGRERCKRERTDK